MDKDKNSYKMTDEDLLTYIKNEKYFCCYCAELKKRVLDIMHRDKCSLISAEQKLLCELLEELRRK